MDIYTPGGWTNADLTIKTAIIDKSNKFIQAYHWCHIISDLDIYHADKLCTHEHTFAVYLVLYFEASEASC